MRNALLAILALAVLPAAAAWPAQAQAQEAIAGRASVIDGDTIEVHGTRIRLFGIDAPESAQSCGDAAGMPYRCGRVATEALDRRLLGKVVTCEPRDMDRYGRVVAVCREGGTDLNAWLVAEGYARAYVRYGRDYAATESAARAAGKGIWQGPFQDPADFRSEHRRY